MELAGIGTAITPKWMILPNEGMLAMNKTKTDYFNLNLTLLLLCLALILQALPARSAEFRPQTQSLPEASLALK